MHYDHRCKDASRVGGFIYGWLNMLTPPNVDPEYRCRASFGDLDLVLKISEMANCLKITQRDLVVDMSRGIRRALEMSQAQLNNLEWQIDE